MAKIVYNIIFFTFRGKVMVNYNSKVVPVLEFLNKLRFPESQDILAYVYSHIINTYSEEDPNIRYAVVNKEPRQQILYNFFNEHLNERKCTIFITISQNHDVTMKIIDNTDPIVFRNSLLKMYFKEENEVS